MSTIMAQEPVISPQQTMPPHVIPMQAPLPVAIGPQGAPSAVCININYPSVGGNIPYSPVYAYPQSPIYNAQYNNAQYNTNQYNNPYPYAQQQPVYIPVSQTSQGSSSVETTKSTTTSKIETDTTKKMKEKEVVKLTNTYLKTLENYLDSPDERTRLMGTKELLARFKEDKTRKYDIALNNLLTKALQDPSPEVRLMALTTLHPSVGYAGGNKYTVMVLQAIQQGSFTPGGKLQTKVDNTEDALMASEILLAMAGDKVKIMVEDDDKQEHKLTHEKKTETLLT